MTKVTTPGSVTRRPMVASLGMLVLVISCSNSAISGDTTEAAPPAPASRTAATSVPTSTVPPATQATPDPAPTSATVQSATTTVPRTTTVQPSSTTTTTLASRDCTPSAPADFRLTEADPVRAAIELSRVVYPCAIEVGLAPASNPEAVATVAASDLNGPLLLVGEWFSGRLVSELRRLEPDRVVTSGFGPDIHSTLFDHRVTVLDIDPEATVPHDPSAHEHLWLVAPAAPVVPLQVAATDLGIGLVVLDPDSSTSGDGTLDLISGAASVEVLSVFGDEVSWQLEVLQKGVEIPGGGIVMFPDSAPRRLVAFYGHPVTSRLGVLGEQDPERGIERLGRVAADYGADGATVLPTFEIIATVASAGPGRDGDYSAETTLDVIRPWIEAAAANGVYVVLDLQPGRTHFLTQAKIYEEFLRLPHVGLALDPEWRLKPDEVHLRQIGTVDAAEINEVVRWLAEIVREEVLPQKLLIVHQFRFSMITNRERIETPDELAVVIQMDGQGSLGAKYNTWNVLTRGTEDRGFRWGWKNFYDEDSPTATPAQVLELTPVPVFVSYQ